MVEVKNLVKNYGKIQALKDVTFEVPKGSILGFLGPNGAGKSTVMNIITGFLAPTEGTVVVDGIDVLEKPLEVRKKVGYLPEQPPLYKDMTVREYLDFVGRLKGVPEKKHKADLANIATIAKITDVMGRLCDNLSKGYKQRVGFAQALIGNPEILILDEPTVGLDPVQVDEFRRTIRILGREHTIILSTHILSEVTATCSDVVIINHGQLAKAGPLSSFTDEKSGEKRLAVTFACGKEEGSRILAGIPEIRRYEFSRIDQGSSVFSVVSKAGTPANVAIFRAAAEANVDLYELKVKTKSLEDEFTEIISKPMGGEL